MTSEFDAWYLDDGSLGNHINRLLSDLEIVLRVGPTIGLVLNEMKCEIVTDDADVVASLKAKMPSTWHVQCHEAVLLGAPAGEQTAVHTVLSSELAVFHRLASRLTSLNAHDALFLLKNCLRISKLLYSLYAVLPAKRAPSFQTRITLLDRRSR